MWWRRTLAVDVAVVVLVVDGAEVARWPLRCAGCADLKLVDQVARFELAARRLGWQVRLCDVNPRFDELLDLVGLRETLTR